MLRGLLRNQVCLTSLTVCCLLVSAMSAAVAQEPAALPGGASSLRETYQDWLVSCAQEKTKRCAISQQQTQQNGQRVLAIEIAAGPGGKTATGTLVMPFGLALDAGIALQIDDKPPGTSLRFSTCLPGGCLVPLSFDEAFLSTLRAGQMLKTTAKTVNNDQPMSFSISLKGFSAAFDRVAVLMK